MIALLWLSIAAAPLVVEARVATTDGGGIGVGAPFTVVIEAKHEPGGIALLPSDLPFDEGKLAERKQNRKHARREEGGQTIDRYELELLAFESGELTIPAIPLALGSTHAETLPIALEVKSGFSDEELPIANSTIAEAMPELEKMAAVDPQPVAVTVEDKTPLWIALGVLGAAAIAFAVWRVLRGRKKIQEAAPIPAPPPRPAHEVAREKLELLRRSGYLERGEKKAFFTAVSEILREYAGARWGFDSLDLTVDELMLELSKHNTAGLDARVLQQLLERADLVKFAKFDPQAAEAVSALSDAADIVEKTKLVPAPEAA